MKPSFMSFFITVGIVMMSSCSTPTVKDTNRLSPGMRKDKVMKIFGEPDSKRGNLEETFLTYSLKPGVWGQKEEYVFVFDEESRLKTYGKKGDFDDLEVTSGRVIQREEEPK